MVPCNTVMTVPRHVLWSFLLIILFVAGCSDNGAPPVLTLTPTVGVDQPADGSNGNPPPAHTPAVPATAPANTLEGTSTALPLTEGEDLEAIDAALQEIDNDLCREAHEARAEIAALLAEGEEVADLEAAIVELIEELENCSLEMTPGP